MAMAMAMIWTRFGHRKGGEGEQSRGAEGTVRARSQTGGLFDEARVKGSRNHFGMGLIDDGGEGEGCRSGLIRPAERRGDTRNSRKRKSSARRCLSVLFSALLCLFLCLYVTLPRRSAAGTALQSILGPAGNTCLLPSPARKQLKSKQKNLIN